MRIYTCFHYYMDKDGNLKQNGNNACWAGIMSYYGKYSTEEYKAIRDIYIDQYTEEETKDYIELMVKVVNRITPCDIVEIKGRNYIHFRLLETYDQSLVLLNFIRNLWHEPIAGYSKAFFEDLKKSRFKDALAKITTANKRACKKVGGGRYYGHSNVYAEGILLVKQTSDLLAYQGNSTMRFLTSANSPYSQL